MVGAAQKPGFVSEILILPCTPLVNHLTYFLPFYFRRALHYFMTKKGKQLCFASKQPALRIFKVLIIHAELPLMQNKRV